MARYTQIHADTRRYAKIRSDTPRYGQIRTDTHRYGDTLGYGQKRTWTSQKQIFEDISGTSGHVLLLGTGMVGHSKKSRPTSAATKQTHQDETKPNRQQLQYQLAKRSDHKNITTTRPAFAHLALSVPS